MVNCRSEMEFDLDKALEEVPVHVEDPPPAPTLQLGRPCVSHGDHLLQPSPLDAEPECVSELPPVEHRTLVHRTKLRPKANKRTRPSRAPVGPENQNHQSPVPTKGSRNKQLRCPM